MEPEEKKRWCDLALCLAVRERQIPITKLLLEGGCDPNVTCAYDKVPLHYVAPAPATSTTMEIVRLLVDTGAKLKSDRWTQSPFSVALSI